MGKILHLVRFEKENKECLAVFNRKIHALLFILTLDINSYPHKHIEIEMDHEYVMIQNAENADSVNNADDLNSSKSISIHQIEDV